MPFLRNLGYGVSTGAGAALRELERQWKNADAATAASTLQDREDARQGVHLRSLASMKAAEHGLAHPEQTEAINAAYGPQGASPLRLPADAELLRPLIHSINAAKSRNELPANVGTAMAAQGVKSALANTSPEDVVLPEANESGNSVDTPLPTPEGYEPPYANQSRKLDEMGLGRDETGTYSTPPAGTVTRETRDFAPQSQQTIESLMKEKKTQLEENSPEKLQGFKKDEDLYDKQGNLVHEGTASTKDLTGPGMRAKWERNYIDMKGLNPDSPVDQNAASDAYDRNHQQIGSTIRIQTSQAIEAGKKHWGQWEDPITHRPVVGWVDQQGNPVGHTLQAKESATVENRLVGAEAVYKTGDHIIKEMSNPSYTKNLGLVMSRYTNVEQMLGNPPPEYADLMGQIESFSLANLGVHGMRAAQQAEVIKHQILASKTPEALAAGVRGLMLFSKTLMEDEGRGDRLTPGGGGTDILYDMKGNRVQ